MLRSKVLSVPIKFANHWSLKNLEVVKPDPSDPSNALYTRQPQRMLLVIGLDLYHYFPPMLDTYRDEHGLVSIPFALSVDASWPVVTEISHCQQVM